MVPVLILGLPLFDTAMVIVSRLRRRFNPLTTPGRDHVSHRIVALGYTRREAVLICYLVCAILGVVALFITQATIIEGYIVGGLTAVAGLAVLVIMERIDFPGKHERGTFLTRRRSH
jgi:UDP-GlcNAc:undecaprenyl-phosphate GlcNAc-1-phosphate transferase